MEEDTSQWFAVPWHDCRKAVGCAIELARLVMPPLVKSKYGQFADHGVGGGPYREALVCQRGNGDDETPARRVEYALQFAQSYVDGTIEEWAVSDDDYDGGCTVSWIWRAAGVYGEDAWRAGYSCQDPAWHVTGDFAKTACNIVQKWAANSTGGGVVPNHFLERAVDRVLSAAAADCDTLSKIVCRWRFRDALGDTEPTEEMRLTFEAAWGIGRYAFAYSLLTPLTSISTPL